MDERKEFDKLQEYAENEAARFTEIFEGYKDMVFAFAYSLTKNHSTAEEVVQEVFLKLWERRNHIQDLNVSFNAYVKTMTYNKVIDFFRKVKKDNQMQDAILQRMQKIRSGQEEWLLNKELEKIYQEAITQLSPQQQRIFRMIREEEMTYQQIADELDISRNTVRNHMSEAIRSVRNYVSSHTDLAVLVLALCFSSINNGGGS